MVFLIIHIFFDFFKKFLMVKLGDFMFFISVFLKDFNILLSNININYTVGQ